jgi:hypothetical protein
LNFTGVIFGNFNYQIPTTPAQLPGQLNNALVLDRAYLNFRMPAGDRMSIRITTDVYQTTESTPNAYTVRAKYAYLQYDVPRAANGSQFIGRLGILQNVAIEAFETFWPRYLSQTAIERAGYFDSADMGAAGLYILPNKMGEVYATLVNGPGYKTREKDRFKDYAIRFTFTPLMNYSTASLLQTFTITGWGYKGALASSLVNTGPVGASLDRSRAGIFVGIRDPRIVLGAEYDRRHDEADAGTSTATRTTSATSGNLVSGLTIIRPLAFTSASHASRFGVVARYDHVSPTAETSGVFTTPPTTGSYHNLIGGVFYDLTLKAQFALDYQEALNASGANPIVPPTQSKTWFAHFRVDF